MRETELDFRNDRDASLKLIDWFDISRVRAAKVLVVGAGAIGNEVLKNLALLGVGNIYIFDRDTIEMSNLSRSVLYRAKDHGQPKALTAARAVRELNPTVNVSWHNGDIDTDLGEGFIRRMDVVIGCLDSMDARHLLNRRCWRVRRPWVDAAIGTLNGQVRVFEPPDGPCFECSHRDGGRANPCNELASANIRRGRIATTPTIASLVAAVQVQECLKLLDPDNWRGRTLSGRQMDFNGAYAYVDIVALPRREDCMAHDEGEIDPEGLVELPAITANTAAGELLAEAQKLLGPDAHLYLQTEIAVERKCAGCGNVLVLMRPMYRAYREDLTCECGRTYRYESDITHTHVVSSRTSLPVLLQAKLRDLGVPAFGIVEARGPGLAVRYLELTGDAAAAVQSEGTEPAGILAGGV